MRKLVMHIVCSMAVFLWGGFLDETKNIGLIPVDPKTPDGQTMYSFKFCHYIITVLQ
ncbi:MAG: hypothetical protein Q8Q56_01355 [Alphaproteobacteria bacterium]|nr:hypothetical protein [Alphaproteobacteria bacterium]